MELHYIYIYIFHCLHREKVFIPSPKEYILLEGDGHQQTSIEWDEAASMQPEGTQGATFSILANNFVIRDITFKVSIHGHLKSTNKNLIKMDICPYFKYFLQLTSHMYCTFYFFFWVHMFCTPNFDFCNKKRLPSESSGSPISGEIELKKRKCQYNN